MPQKTYIDRISSALIDVIERAASGSDDRLAGYVANLDFWLDEAAHCLQVIAGYEDRFERFHEAQQKIVAERGRMKWAERGWRSPPSEISPTSEHDDLKGARRRLIGAITKFLDRCVKEEMISSTQRKAALKEVGAP